MKKSKIITDFARPSRDFPGEPRRAKNDIPGCGKATWGQNEPMFDASPEGAKDNSPGCSEANPGITQVRQSLKAPKGPAQPVHQYAYALFPEYGYAYESDKCRTLEKAGYYWCFRQNGNYGKVHFTPIWYPNGNYTVKIIKSDCWTPSGMITTAAVTNTITISGSAYDDWYVGR
jgi:hypothetical protein